MVDLRKNKAQTLAEIAFFVVLGLIFFGLHVFLRQAHSRAVRAGQPPDEYEQLKEEASRSLDRSSLEQPRLGEVRPLDEQGRKLVPDVEFKDGHIVKTYPRPLEEYTRFVPGSDGKLRAPNSYLVHYAPFVTDDPWTPLVAVSYRLKYAFDFQQYWRDDAWQTSRETYRIRHGDCEDHAILVVDWLIEMGYDARVVVGDWNMNPHAWVVVVDHGQTYLLETVEKTLTKRVPPLAMFDLAHNPRYMFDQDSFWVRKDGTWKKLSEFEEGGS